MRPAKWTKNCGVIRQKRPHKATLLPCVSHFIVEINETNRRKKKGIRQRKTDGGFGRWILGSIVRGMQRLKLTSVTAC